MDNAFSRAARVLHSDANLSKAAIYGLPGGASLPVRVIEIDAEADLEINGQLVLEAAAIFEILKEAVPERPLASTKTAQAATIQIGAALFSIYNVDSSNSRRQAWRCVCKAVK